MDDGYYYILIWITSTSESHFDASSALALPSAASRPWEECGMFQQKRDIRAAKSWISPSILWDIWEESTCFDGTKKGFLSFLLVYLRIYTFEDRRVILEEVTKKSGKCWIHQPAPIRFDVLRGPFFSRCLPWLPYTSNGNGGSL